MNPVYTHYIEFKDECWIALAPMKLRYDEIEISDGLWHCGRPEGSNSDESHLAPP
jgi:hypothetical protein